MEVVFVISVIILDGFSDESVCLGKTEFSEISSIYIPLLLGVLRYNGIMCDVLKTHGFEHEYGIVGKNNDNIIYVPVFSIFAAPSKISFIYTDSTATDSPSFRIASTLRERRSVVGEKVVFVNELHENDPLKRTHPIIVDNFCFEVEKEPQKQDLYSFAKDVAISICTYYKHDFSDPVCSI